MISFSISFFLENRGENKERKTSTDNKTTIIIVLAVLLVSLIITIVAIIIIHGKKSKWVKRENCLCISRLTKQVFETNFTEKIYYLIYLLIYRYDRLLL